jgi:pyruvate/2-oxoglutarate dehydrogenase complex dihydrolipoamide dehydrogenase (E3) component
MLGVDVIPEAIAAISTPIAPPLRRRSPLQIHTTTRHLAADRLLLATGREPEHPESLGSRILGLDQVPYWTPEQLIASDRPWPQRWVVLSAGDPGGGDATLAVAWAQALARWGRSVRLMLPHPHPLPQFERALNGWAIAQLEAEGVIVDVASLDLDGGDRRNWATGDHGDPSDPSRQFAIDSPDLVPNLAIDSPDLASDPRTDPRTDLASDPRTDLRTDPRTDLASDPRTDPRTDPRINPRINPRTDLDNPFAGPANFGIPTQQVQQIGEAIWVQTGSQAVETEALLVVGGDRPNIPPDLFPLWQVSPPQLWPTARSLPVTPHLRTCHPQIYACGSVLGGSPDPALAQHEAAIAIAQTPLPSRPWWQSRHHTPAIPTINYAHQPITVPLDPPLARVGLSRSQAIAHFGSTVRHQGIHAAGRSIDLITHRDGRLLGAAAAGAGAIAWIACVATVVQRGGTVDELRSLPLATGWPDPEGDWAGAIAFQQLLD